VKKNETIQNINGIGYLHVIKLFSTNMKKNLQALQQYESIIIDMRGYPNSHVFLALANNIFPLGTSFFSETYPDIVDIGKILLVKGYRLGHWNKLKNKNIVILVDENTQSQAEFLVMALQQKPNVKVIGTPTAGADGNAIFLSFPGNIRTSLTGIGIVYPDGGQTQRCGIKIDYPVNPTIKDYQTTQDPILDYATKYLASAH
jgi:C-terminal processing protease CtpA/Prc